jgi:hypothetical protein
MVWPRHRHRRGQTVSRELEPGVASLPAGRFARCPRARRASARLARTPLGMGSLRLLLRWTLDKVIQSVEGTNRLGVCRCPGDLRRRIVYAARRAAYLTSKSATSTQTRDNGCTDRSSRLLAHSVSPLLIKPSRKPQGLCRNETGTLTSLGEPRQTSGGDACRRNFAKPS